MQKSFVFIKNLHKVKQNVCLYIIRITIALIKTIALCNSEVLHDNSLQFQLFLIVNYLFVRHFILRAKIQIKDETAIIHFVHFINIHLTFKAYS